MFIPENDSANLLDDEEQLLRFLVTATASQEVVRSILDRLRTHRFQSVEHQVLFECVASLHERGAGNFRELLPAHLVRAGFPEVDLERFFEQAPISTEHALAACSKLAQGPSH